MRKKQIIRSLAVCATLLLLLNAAHAKADTSTTDAELKVASSIVNVKSVVSIVNSMTKEEKAVIEAKKAEEEKAAAEKAKKEAEEKAAAEKAKREDEERIAVELEAHRSAKTEKLFGLDDFMFRGVVYWNGYKFTYYSEKVLPGGGLRIPGRHVNADGYVADEEGYIVLAGDAPMGSVFETPFGYKGKIYDRGTSGNHLDVYISR